MKSDYAYILGFGTLSLGLFLGSKWSPDYQEFCTNGNNFLWFVGFAICILIMMVLVDRYYSKRTNSAPKEEKNGKM